MTEKTRWDPSKSRTFSERQWFWFLAFMGLLTRLPFLSMPKAETTDGILSLTYFSPDRVSTPRFVILPGYPALLWVTGDQVFVGRLLAALAGLLFLIPLWKFARRWMSPEMSGIVCLMALFSPLLWCWSLKVMGDTLFLMFFWWSLERLTAAYIDENEAAWWWGNLLAAAAACTRPEGFLLLPWIVILAFRMKTKGRAWLTAAAVPAIWSVPFYCVKDKLATLLYAYREGIGTTPGTDPDYFPFLNFLEHFYAYLSQPLYVFTPLVFWFAILGLSKIARSREKKAEAVHKIMFQVYILLLLSRLVPTTYQDRHMLPFLPLLLVAAGYHLEDFFGHWGSTHGALKTLFFKNVLLLVCFSYMALFSAAALMGVSDSFGDIRRSAEFLKTLPVDAVVYSDEIPKTEYWSGREVLPIVFPFMPKKGTYVMLHSFYTPRLSFVDQNMRNRFGAQDIHDEDSMVVPVLTDIMQDPKVQNRVEATAYRFIPQFFQSTVYLITKDRSQEGPS